MVSRSNNFQQSDAMGNYEDDYDERNSSGLSLNGRSLIVPDYGDVDDMSSIGTSKYTYRGDGENDNDTTISDVKLESDNTQSPKSPLERKLSQLEKDPEIQDENVREEKKYDKDVRNGARCLPRWIANAPLWLKMVIIASISLLIGAAALIAVGAMLSKSASSVEENPSATTEVDVTNQGEVPQTGLTPSDTSTEIEGLESITEYIDSIVSTPTPSPSITPTEKTLSPIPVVTPSPTTSPTFSLSNATTSGPTSAPSYSPTQNPTFSEVNFFVTGGRMDGPDAQNYFDGLKSLPNINGNTVLFHTGDWNSPFATSCDEESFVNNVRAFNQTSIPVYFVPGDNEFNDCPNATEAMGFWKNYMLDFETKYWPEPSWNIVRQVPDYSENFAFLQSQILFVGINLVGGIVHDQDEWDARHDADLQWINSTAIDYDGNFTTMVVIAHADPAIAINANFFLDFLPLVETFDHRVIFVHRNLGDETWGRERGFNNIPNLDVVTIEGSVWPPLWMQIDSISGNYTIDQSSWFDAYTATGTLSPSPVRKRR